MLAASGVYSALAVFVLGLHALFILWVIFGAFVTRSRPVHRWLHIAALVWGIFTELFPWRCPLTLLENWLEAKAGVQPYQGGFLLHYMDKLGLSGSFCHCVDSGWRDRLHLQPCARWKAGVENPALILESRLPSEVRSHSQRRTAVL